jgi:hypothetical protein
MGKLKAKPRGWKEDPKAPGFEIVTPDEIAAYRVFRTAARDLLRATESARPILQARDHATKELTTASADKLVEIASACVAARKAAEGAELALMEKQAAFRAAMAALSELAAPPIK